ncbi:MAG: hypothetical protein DI563_01965 [Variovorax paradoxus]|uniref:Portal protein n=1 Tax=Variovorax paradoxus TaxID=34073 RepID=A0A2W5QKZ8_VARPD|nr:MAG: hypothetical protein DI563_01965 [Variovorax paradoxus]
MTDEDLLSHLQAQEDDSSAFVWGELSEQRRAALQEYFRAPYGNEEEGWSAIVTSEVQDTIEWILPDLLEMFTSNDKAVEFEPNREKDVAGAAQATDSCNYVFYKQNNGFLILYTAFKDALQLKNCAVHWRKETRRDRDVQVLRGINEMQLTLALEQAGEGAKIEAATPVQQIPMMDPLTQGPAIDPGTGTPIVTTIYDARISHVVERRVVRVEAFEPENLLVQREWKSPLLDECPYVARILPVTLSDLRQMGFDEVTAEDLAASPDSAMSTDATYRDARAGAGDEVFRNVAEVDSEDESLTRGYLRIEYVLVDFDGDGIAERRCVYRLRDRILSNDECGQVQIATASPVLVQHRWEGMSIAEMVSDLQKIKTDLTRAVMNNATMAVSPRKTVLTTPDGAPLADVDDLLDSRPGGIQRMRQAGAVTYDTTPWVGHQMFPLLEYVDQMGERRTGVSKMQQGIDPNALRTDRTAYEAGQLTSAAQKRIKLIARILAEILMKPVFQGILKLLTEGDMERLAFRLRGEFVEFDPNEWRDRYDMTSNVGLGTGDAPKQHAMLMGILQNQMGIAQSPFGPLLISPKKIYNTQAKLVENAGYKNVGDFWNDPGDAQVPQSGPPPQVLIEQAKMQHQGQLEQLKLQFQAKEGELKRQQDAQLELVRAQAQQATDANRQEMEARQHQLRLQQEAELQALRSQYDDVRHQREMDFRWQVEQLKAATDLKKAEYAATKAADPATTNTAAAEIQADVTQP